MAVIVHAIKRIAIPIIDTLMVVLAAVTAVMGAAMAVAIVVIAKAGIPIGAQIGIVVPVIADVVVVVVVVILPGSNITDHGTGTSGHSTCMCCMLFSKPSYSRQVHG